MITTASLKCTRLTVPLSKGELEKPLQRDLSQKCFPFLPEKPYF